MQGKPDQTCYTVNIVQQNKKTMKIVSILFCLLLSANAIGQTVVESLQHNEVTRSYRVHLPPDFDASESLPLVLNYHGIGSNAFEQELYSTFNNIADTANFIVVYPEGLIDTLDNGNIIRHWNCYFGSDSDDVGFTSALIDTLQEDYNIDLNRVYSTGMSNGGFMSYMLACELSHRITAIASVTGALSFIQQENCNPSRTVPVMEIHGTADETVPYLGSESFYPSAPEFVDFWVELNGCDMEPTTMEIPDIDTGDNCTASLEIFGGCDEDSEVQFYTIDGGGHTWPGAFNFVGSVTNQDFEASEVIWQFFKRFEHPNPTIEAPIDSMVTDSMTTDTMVVDTVWATSIEDMSIEGFEHSLRFFPNPVQDFLTIETENTSIISVEVLDLSGKVISTVNTNATEFSGKIEMSQLNSGLYFLKVETLEGIVVEKILKD